MNDRFHIREVTTPADWQSARAIRRDVFVDEQSCPPELEWDRYDPISRHYLGFYQGLQRGENRGLQRDPGQDRLRGADRALSRDRLDETPVGTARWRTVDYEGRRWAKLERFAVLEAHRGQKYGSRLVRHLLKEAERAGIPDCLIHAQIHLTGFYRRFDFEVVGDPFEEAGIPHRRMVRRA